MATRLGDIEVRISANSSGFVRSLKKADASLASTAAKFKQVGSQFTDVGTTLTKAVTLPIVGIGGLAVKAASDFESAFAGVIKTVDDATDEFGNLTKVGEELRTGFRELSKEIPLSAVELAGIGEAAGQLGIATGDIIDFTEVMAKLGLTTNLSADEAATALARFRNITQENTTSFNQLGSTVVALGNNLATTEAEIVELGLRLAGAGRQVGLTEAQILGLSGALSSVGIRAEAGGTAISKAIVEIAKSVDTGGPKLEEFSRIAGKTSEEFATLFRTDAAAAISAFIEGLGRVSETGESTFAVLEDLGLSNIRLRDSLLRLSGAGDLVARSLGIAGEATRDATALNAEAAQRIRTFESQLKLFGQAITDIKIDIGNELLPALRDMLEQSKPVIARVKDMVKAFRDLSPETKKSVFQFTLLAAAVGPAAIAVGGLFTVMAAGITVVRGLTAALALLFSPVGLIVGTLAVAVVGTRALADSFTALVAKTKQLGLAIKGGITDALAFFAEKLGELVSKIPVIGPALAKAFDGLSGILRDESDRMAEEFARLEPIAATTSGAIGRAFADTFGELPGLVAPAMTEFGSSLFAASEEVGGEAGRQIAEGIEAATSKAKPTIPPVEVEVAVDDTELKKTEKFVEEFRRQNPKVEIGADLSEAKSEIQLTQKQVDELTAKPVFVSVEAETDEARRRLTEFDGVLISLTSATRPLTIEAITADAEAKIARLQEIRDNLTDADEIIELDADIEEAERKLGDVLSQKADLEDPTQMTVTADTSQAEAAIRSVNEALDEAARRAGKALNLATADEFARGSRPGGSFGVDTEALRAELRALKAAADPGALRRFGGEISALADSFRPDRFAFGPFNESLSRNANEAARLAVAANAAASALERLDTSGSSVSRSAGVNFDGLEKRVDTSNQALAEIARTNREQVEASRAELAEFRNFQRIIGAAVTASSAESSRRVYGKTGFGR